MAEEKGRYDDIINIPHHISMYHPQMSITSRAAQFAPFAAVVGYDSAIYETARHTDAKIELDESRIEYLDTKLRCILLEKAAKPMIQITYFKADKTKHGGKYITVKSRIKKFDDYRKEIVLENNQRIFINDLYDIKDIN